MQAVAPCTTCARGAASSHEFIAPHSSASTCPKPMTRSAVIGMSRVTASDSAGNIPRSPQWNSIGSSAWMRKWLKVKPAGGAMSGTCTDSR
jgi:hypothetical protein